jgi:hypothetical protein
MAKNEIVKDSGSMENFESGAHRDCAIGKGRCDLLVLDYSGLFMMNDPVLANVSIFMDTRDPKNLLDALQCSLNTVPVFRYDEILAEMATDGIEMRVYENEKDKAKACMAHVLLEASKIFEAGALRYGVNNWQLSMPVNRYIDSGVRHYLKTIRGDIDEPHYRGFVWNMLCAMWTCDHFPEMNYKEEPKRPDQQ